MRLLALCKCKSLCFALYLYLVHMSTGDSQYWPSTLSGHLQALSPFGSLKHRPLFTHGLDTAHGSESRSISGTLQLERGHVRSHVVLTSSSTTQRSPGGQDVFRHGSAKLELVGFTFTCLTNRHSTKSPAINTISVCHCHRHHRTSNGRRQHFRQLPQSNGHPRDSHCVLRLLNTDILQALGNHLLTGGSR